VDSAFLEILLRPENAEQLEDLLLYHILPGSYPSASLEPGPIETLLSGESVTVSLNPIMFDDSGVSDVDITACNGLLYALRSVLLPATARTSYLCNADKLIFTPSTNNLFFFHEQLLPHQ
jgi:uncharacterized surface protein with fasciclin (FAS1) repeats